MNTRFFIPLIMILLCCAGNPIRAQHSFAFNNGPAMDKYQDSLLSISEELFSLQNNNERYAKNAAFIKTLVNSLKIQGSFAYPFDSLKKITVLPSPDNSFRIFSWGLPSDDGTYRFFGAIQMATRDGKLKLFPLIDETASISDANLVTNNKKWYGARYYEIVPVLNAGKTAYYVLLGWKGNNDKTSKKVIEVLSFSQDQATFGKAVLEASKGGPMKNRIVFEYNKLNSMTLTLDKSTNMIVFDHLAPFSPDMAGNFEFYASDLSFDAYKLINGRLKLVENIELKNDPSAMDEFYADPSDKTIRPSKKL